MTSSTEMSSDKLQLAVISHLFPNDFSPAKGKFIKDHITLLENDPCINPVLIVPTPYSFPLTKRHKQNNSSLLFPKNSTYRIKYLSFPKKQFPTIANASLSKNIKSFLKDKKFNGIHIHWLYPDGLCIPVLKEMDLDTILTIHGSDWYKNYTNKKLQPLIEDSFEKADRILLVGPNLLQDIKSAFPQFENKLFEIGNFVDEGLYTIPTEEQKRKAQASLNWSSGKNHFLTVANFRKEKGVDVLIDAINQLPESLTSTTEFHIVGTSDSESVPISNIPGFVSLHPPVPPQQLINFYHASDSYISPSRNEGFGLALIEAAACGLPLIATSTGIATNYIEDNIGLLCSTDNSQELYHSINKIIERMENFSPQVIRDKVVRMFGKESYRKKLLTHYQECFTI